MFTSIIEIFPLAISVAVTVGVPFLIYLLESRRRKLAEKEKETIARFHRIEDQLARLPQMLKQYLLIDEVAMRCVVQKDYHMCKQRLENLEQRVKDYIDAPTAPEDLREMVAVAKNLAERANWETTKLREEHNVLAAEVKARACAHGLRLEECLKRFVSKEHQREIMEIAEVAAKMSRSLREVIKK